MLSKKRRLKTREVQMLFKSGSFSSNNVFTIKFKRNSLNISRFGVAVSLKIARGAVQRNKLRRLIYKIVRNNFQRIKSGIDCLIIPKTNGDLTADVAEKNLFDLLSKNGLLKNQQHNNE